jgi:APA family basic amino acid/polyamine antiporter
MPEAARPYRTLGYPLMPLLFVLVSVWLIINTLIERRVESVTGLVLILIGLPLYFHFRAARRLRSGS